MSNVTSITQHPGEAAASVVLSQWKSNDAAGLTSAASRMGELVDQGLLKRDRAIRLIEWHMDIHGYDPKDRSAQYLKAFEDHIANGAKPIPSNDNAVAPAGSTKPKWQPTSLVPASRPKSNRDYDPVTQDVIAERFARVHRDELLYCHSQGAWFEWDGAIWRKNEKKKAFDLVRLLARDNSRGLTPKEVRTIQSSSFARGVETFVQADSIFSRSASDWDRDPWRLGTPQGTVDLRTGYLEDPDQKDMITKSTAVAPGAGLACPLWLKFLALLIRANWELSDGCSGKPPFDS
jgi:D5 N terminal like